MKFWRNEPSAENQIRRYSAVRPLAPNDAHSSSRSPPAIAAWPAASLRASCAWPIVPGAGAGGAGVAGPGSFGAGGSAPASPRTVFVPARVVTLIEIFLPASASICAAGRAAERHVLILPFCETRLSLIEPAFTLLGLVAAVNGREEVSFTSIVALSPARWSETAAFSDAADAGDANRSAATTAASVVFMGANVPRPENDMQCLRLGRRLLSPILVQAPVVAAGRQQLLVRALLDDPAVLEHDDLAGALDRGQPVRDHDRGAAGQQAPQAVLDPALGVHVDVRGGLVQDQDPRVGDERAGERDELALPGRELHAALADRRVVALGEARDELVRPNRVRRRRDVLGRRVGAPERDVLADRAAEQERLLRHDAHLRAQRGGSHVAQVVPVDEDPA